MENTRKNDRGEEIGKNGWIKLKTKHYLHLDSHCLEVCRRYSALVLYAVLLDMVRADRREEGKTGEG